MKIKSATKILLLFFTCCSISAQGFSQAQWEVDWLREINPRFPDDNTWKSFSSSAKPIAIAVPFTMLAVSLISENKKGERNAFEMVGAIVIAAAVTEGLKLIVKRPRPYETYPEIYPDFPDYGNAYPSGHTSIAFATATSLTLTTKKWYLAIPAFAWATGVGYSRMYLGQHYASDVYVGAAVGAASAYAAHWLHKKILKKKKK